MTITITIALPYIRIGSRELWIDRVSPRKRGALVGRARQWFSIERDTQGFHLGLAWWDVQMCRVRLKYTRN